MLLARSKPRSEAEIKFNISQLDKNVYNFKLSNTVGDELLFGYNHTSKTFYVDRRNSGDTEFSSKFAHRVSTAPRTSSNTHLSGTLLIDKTSIEIFYDDGETVMTEIFFPNAPFENLSLSSENGEFILDHLEAYELDIRDAN